MEDFLTANEVQKICGFPLKVTTTSQLHNKRSIEQLFFSNSPGALILFQDNHGEDFFTGHFCCLLKLHEKLIFFDSYGQTVGVQYEYISKKYRSMTNQLRNDIARLMVNSRYKDLFYNEFQYQKMKKGINTCGRWCGLFLKSNMLPYKFKHLISDLHKTIAPNSSLDKLSVILTKPVIGH